MEKLVGKRRKWTKLMGKGCILGNGACGREIEGRNGERGIK